MRPKLHRIGLFAGLFLTLMLPLSAQSKPVSTDFDTSTLTVRQVWENITTLYGSGHTFTADEFGRLKNFQKEVVEAGDSDVADRLTLLMLAASRENAAADDVTRLDKSQADWKAVLEQDKRAREAQVWGIARNIGLGSYVFSTASALGFAGMITRAEGHASADDQKLLEYGMYWSLGAMALSLVPLITGEVTR